MNLGSIFLIQLAQTKIPYISSKVAFRDSFPEGGGGGVAEGIRENFIKYMLHLYDFLELSFHGLLNKFKQMFHNNNITKEKYEEQITPGKYDQQSQPYLEYVPFFKNNIFFQ